MTTATDTTLRARAGDAEAFDSLVRTWQSEVWKIASYALRDRAATEDLVQAIFLEVYLSLERYDPARDFGAWLRGLARNQVRAALRKEGRRKRQLEAYRQWYERASDAEADAREEELRTALAACRQTLSAPVREALTLRYERAQPATSIAERLARSPAAVRQLLVRARTALRRCIEQRMKT